MVEAELLAAEGGRTAAIAGGVKVMAGWTGCVHGGLLQKRKAGLKAKGPARTLGLSPFLTQHFQYTKRTITHLLCREKIHRVWFEGVGGFCTDLGG
jgi:hypothetical protein